MESAWTRERRAGSFWNERGLDWRVWDWLTVQISMVSIDLSLYDRDKKDQKAEDEDEDVHNEGEAFRHFYDD